MVVVYQIVNGVGPNGAMGQEMAKRYAAYTIEKRPKNNQVFRELIRQFFFCIGFCVDKH